MDKLEKKILEQSDEPNTKLPAVQTQRKTNHKNIQVIQHKPHERGEKPVNPKESKH